MNPNELPNITNAPPKPLAKKAKRYEPGHDAEENSTNTGVTPVPPEHLAQDLFPDTNLNTTWQLAVAEVAAGTLTEAAALPNAQAASVAAATETSALSAVVSTTVPSGVAAATGVVGVASAAKALSTGEPANQAPVVSAALKIIANEGDSATTINLLENATDANNDTLSISNITYKVGAGSTSSDIPNGLILSGNILHLDPSNNAFNSLTTGVTETIVINYTISDGRGGSVAQTATLIITGTNDSAEVGGVAMGTLTEDEATTVASGTLTASDVDNPANTFVVVSASTTSSQGYGTYTVTDGGLWTYKLDSTHATVNALSEGQSLRDTFTVNTIDGTAQIVTITINGSNDAAVISGSNSASLIETDAALSASGTLTSTDMDGVDNLFTAQTDLMGGNGYGTFNITSTGLWTYTMGTAHNEFVSGKTYADSATVSTADGTRQVLTVTITGTEDLPVLSIASSTRLIDEDLNNSGRVMAYNGNAADLGVVNAATASEEISLTDADTTNFGGDTLKISLTSGSTTQLHMGVNNASGMFSVDSSGYVHYYSDATYDGNTGLNVTPHTTSNTNADIVIGAIDSAHQGLHGDSLWIHLYDTATPAITQALASKIYLGVTTTTTSNSATQDWYGAAGTKTVQFELDDSSDIALTSAQRTVSIVSHADVTSASVVGGIYTTGDTLTVTLTADETVYVDTTNGTPQCQLEIGGTTQYATYTGGRGTKQLTFAYVVGEGLSDTDGIHVWLTPLISSGAVVTDSSGSIVFGSNGYTTFGYYLSVLVASTAGTTPLVSFVDLDIRSKNYFTPGDTIYFNVGFDQGVLVSGTPQLQLTLTDVNGFNHTVYATCQTTTDSSGTTALRFDYTFDAADTNNMGGQFHIVGLSTANGGSITSASNSVAADLTLHNATATADYWLYANTTVGSTGTNGNDLLAPWLTGSPTVPKSLTGSGISGGTDTGSNQRDALNISILLPSAVTTYAEAALYSLAYSNSAKTVSLLKAGSIVSGYTYTVPSTASSWPDGIESLVYDVIYKDTNSDVLTAPASAIQILKSVETFTDVVNANDLVVQGSYMDDTINLSSYSTTQRITVKAGYGNDTINGHSGSDIVAGQSGNDTIYTGFGEDTILLGSGTDTIDAGMGFDTLRIQMHGAEFRAAYVTASSQSLELQSARGTWLNGVFTADASGYTSDYTFSFSETTGKVSVVCQSASGLSGTSSVTDIEQIEMRFTNSYARAYELVNIGTTGNDTLTANGVVWAGAGNDTINVKGDSVVFAGDGDDTVVMASADLFESTKISFFVGGSGIDTLKLSDSAPPTTPSGNWGINTQQFEVFDMTGAGNNTFRFSTSLLLNQGNTETDIWGPLAGYSGMQQLMAKGDAADTVSFLNTGWVKADTTTTVDSVVFDIWTYSASSLQLLLQHGMQTTVI